MPTPAFTLRTGALRRRLTIETATATSNTEGDTSTTWKSLGDVWASIEPASASEQQIAAQRGEKIDYDITLRFRSDLPPPGLLRFIYQGRIFFVRSMTDPGERRRWLNFSCEETATTRTGTG